MNKIYLLILCLFVCPFLSAQSLDINGNIVISDAAPDNSRVVIAKNGNKIDEQVLTKKGRFDLKLALGSDYKLTFEKDGYVTKIVNVNTEVPEEVIESNPNFPPVKLIINLLPTVQDVDLSVFDQPIAILAYNAEVDDFTFDKDYSNKIKDRVAQTEQKIKQSIASRGAAAQERERRFAELVSKGQQAFERKAWNGAIDHWSQALEIKPENESLKQKIAAARREAELEDERLAIELQNKKSYQILISTADSLFGVKKYTDAREKYVAATQLNSKETYPASKIREIDSILAALAKQEAEQQKQLEATEAAYKKALAIADQSFTSKAYETSISQYRQASGIKPQEVYPKEMIAKAEQAIAELKKQQAQEAEQRRLEEEKRNGLKNKYNDLIAQADEAFGKENYAMAKLRYTDADNLNLGEEYPKKRIQEINTIINSTKYKVKLEEYNKNKTLAEKNMQQKNYASAKVYYQKALALLAVDKEEIEQRIAEIDRMIETARLAEIEKAYKENIGKADKAYTEKAYAVARFYYKKALEIKIADKHATERLQEVEKYIGDRQEKEAEL